MSNSTTYEIIRTQRPLSISNNTDEADFVGDDIIYILNMFNDKQRSREICRSKYLVVVEDVLEEIRVGVRDSYGKVITTVIEKVTI